MPDTDRRTRRRPARPRRYELTESRGYITMPNVAPYRVTTDHHESESTMRELFAFIKAAADLGLHKLKIRLDQAFADLADPFDVELPELDPDGIVDPTEATGPEIEAFLNRVAAVTSTIEVHPSMVTAYMHGVLGIELAPWQHDLLAAYYGKQVQA